MPRGRKGLSITLCSAMLLIALDATATRFYKSVDENGNVIFSDRPAAAGAEQIEIEVFTPDVASPPVASKPADGTTKNNQPSNKEEKDAEKDLKALQATREKNCKTAKDRLHKLQTISRLYSEDDKGNRTYVTDEDRVKQLADARTAISEWCK